MNGLAYIKHRLGSPSDPFLGERILECAQNETGLEDFGTGLAWEGLCVLARSVEEEGGLHPFGRRLVFESLVKSAADRLRLIDYLKKHPEVNQDEIRRPLLVTGFPRTGTTLLHNLLAQDPQARPLMAWEAASPVPSNYNKPDTPDRRQSDLRRNCRAIRFLAPELEKLHALHFDRPEECAVFLRNSFLFNPFTTYPPSYAEWLDDQQPEARKESYQFYLSQLRVVQREGPKGHFALKAPAHFPALEAYFEVLADAAVVRTHRDPVQFVPSACSLYAISGCVRSDKVGADRLGPETLQRFEITQQEVLDSDDRLPDKQVLDVRYTDLVKAPLETVQRIYEYHGLAFSDEMEERISCWLRENPQHKHGRHRYTAGQFALKNEQIRDVLKPYCERFGV